MITLYLLLLLLLFNSAAWSIAHYHYDSMRRTVKYSTVRDERRAAQTSRQR